MNCNGKVHINVLLPACPTSRQTLVITPLLLFSLYVFRCRGTDTPGFVADRGCSVRGAFQCPVTRWMQRDTWGGMTIPTLRFVAGTRVTETDRYATTTNYTLPAS